jgi:hypothetical protein
VSGEVSKVDTALSRETVNRWYRCEERLPRYRIRVIAELAYPQAARAEVVARTHTDERGEHWIFATGEVVPPGVRVVRWTHFPIPGPS